MSWNQEKGLGPINSSVLEEKGFQRQPDPQKPYYDLSKPAPAGTEFIPVEEKD